MQKELVAWSLSALDSSTIHDCLVSDIKTSIRQNHMAFPLMFTCMLMIKAICYTYHSQWSKPTETKKGNIS